MVRSLPKSGAEWGSDLSLLRYQPSDLLSLEAPLRSPEPPHPGGSLAPASPPASPHLDGGASGASPPPAGAVPALGQGQAGGAVAAGGLGGLGLDGGPDPDLSAAVRSAERAGVVSGEATTRYGGTPLGAAQTPGLCGAEARRPGAARHPGP